MSEPRGERSPLCGARGAILALLAASVAVGCGNKDDDLENEDFLPSAQYLPTLRITTDEAAPITSKDEYVAGSVAIEPIDGSDPCALSATRMEIKGRGNTTWGMPKKPYALKLEDSAPLCGMPAAENWVLLANYADKTLLRNMVAFTLAERFGLEHTPQSHFVEVYLNGRYDGVYQLTEKIEAEDNRIELSDDGFVLEADDRTWAEDDVGFVTQRGTHLLIQEPGDLSEEQTAAIQGYIEALETALYSEGFADPVNGYAKYMDTRSFIRWGLVNELFRNLDANFHSSCWMYGEDAEAKLFMGPVWDFDIAAGNADYDNGEKTEGWWVFDAAWLKRMMEDPAFRQAVTDTWNELKAEHIDTLPALIDELAAGLAGAQENNFNRWPILDAAVWPNPQVGGSYEAELDYLKTWLSQRAAWMDGELN